MNISARGTFVVFFFNDTATTEIYTLSLHDALPISIVLPFWRLKMEEKHKTWSLSVKIEFFKCKDPKINSGLLDSRCALLEGCLPATFLKLPIARIVLQLMWHVQVDGAMRVSIQQGGGNITPSGHRQQLQAYPNFITRQ